MLSGENDLALLIEDGNSGSDEAILSFPRKIDDLQCGVESIPCMNLFENLREPVARASLGNRLPDSSIDKGGRRASPLMQRRQVQLASLTLQWW